MNKQKWKIRKTYHRYVVKDSETEFEPSQTVQGQALSVSEIYNRNLQDQYGQDMNYEGIDEVSEDYIDLDDMTFDELRSYKEDIEERLTRAAQEQKKSKTEKPKVAKNETPPE